MAIVNLADLVCPSDPQGRTFRQINAARKHEFPLESLVELDDGERLYVKRHTRDCDQTPLYSLGTLHEEDPHRWSHGHYGVKLIRLPDNGRGDT